MAKRGISMRPLYIFDLDGTLALNDHRKHFIADKKNQCWDEFYRACADDKPNKSVITLFAGLVQPNRDIYGCAITRAEVLIFSGRSDLVAVQTVKWLRANLPYTNTDDILSMLRMREHGDNTPDEILKKQWYDELPQEDKNRLVCVFDDRQKVVDMWRSIGVTCLQVAKGDF